MKGLLAGVQIATWYDYTYITFLDPDTFFCSECHFYVTGENASVRCIILILNITKRKKRKCEESLFSFIV